jgi:hypothetical protein
MIKEITVKFRDVEYLVKRSNRALMFWEDYTKKSIDELSGTLTDMLTIFYCVLVVNNKEFNFKFDEFVDLTDENPEAFAKFQEYLIDLSLDVLSDDTNKKKIKKSLK